MDPLYSIILAAGAGTRMGGPKALARHGDRTFLDVVLETTREVDGLRIAVVLSVHAEAVLESHDLSSDLVIWNPSPEKGPISSIRAALAVPEVARAPAVLVHPVDHPRVRATTLRAIVNAFQREKAPIVVPTFHGRGGHPTLFARSVHAELLAPGADQGARSVVRHDPARVARIEVPDPGILANLNRPEDLIG